MKVLHLAAGNLFGGIETLLVVLAHARGLAPAMEPSFGVCFEGALVQRLRQGGAPTHVLGAARARSPWTVRAVREKLRRLLTRERFDVVVCHASWCQAIFASIAHELRIPQVLWLHDAPARRHWLEWWARRSPCDLVICNSEFTQSTVDRVSRASSVVIRCPVAPHAPMNPGDRTRLRHRLKAGPRTVAIICVSRMEAWKGHRLLLTALQRMTAIDDWHCWIVGGPQRPFEQEYFNSLCEQSGAVGLTSRVTFLGQREDVAQLMQAADIYCQANVTPEPFGIAFVEALHAGLPVVTFGFGGVTEVVDANCGRLVKPGDPNALSLALTSLIGDAGTRRELGAAGVLRAHAMCSPVAQMAKLSVVLEGVARGNRSPDMRSRAKSRRRLIRTGAEVRL